MPAISGTYLPPLQGYSFRGGTQAKAWAIISKPFGPYTGSSETKVAVCLSGKLSHITLG